MKAAFGGRRLGFSHPKLIVLDEPFSGLDPLVRDELIQGLLETGRKESTIFISSHDLAEVESFCQPCWLSRKGASCAFSEELTSLVDRFREVELTLHAPSTLPSNFPPTWMQVSASAAGGAIRGESIRFREDTCRYTESIWGNEKTSRSLPCHLRSIFFDDGESRGKDWNGEKRVMRQILHIFPKGCPSLLA